MSGPQHLAQHEDTINTGNMGWGGHSWGARPFIVRPGIHCTGRVHVHTKKAEGQDFRFAGAKERCLMWMGQREDGMGGNSFDILGRRADFNLQVGMGGRRKIYFTYGRKVSFGDIRENASGMIGLHGLLCRGHSAPG